MKYLKKFETHEGYEEYLTGDTMVRPNVSYCEDFDDVHYNPYIHDYSQDYFTTVALENGTISFNIWSTMGTDMITSISYSTDDGETWTTTNNIDNKSANLQITVNVNEGDKLLWKGVARQLGFSDDYGNYVGSFFSSTCEFDAKGNVMSLVYGDNYMNETTIEYVGQFACLFRDYHGDLECKIVNTRYLSLPATTLSNGCYSYMFSGCTNLTSSPQLPATTLAESCYNSMFYNCTSLTTAPELPATTLAEYCYYYMFYNCTSLTTAPELPSITLTEYCYGYMFYNCTSLATAPELPATTLAGSCYDGMFNGCIRLTSAPELPATTLARNCYSGMFQGCQSLTTAPELPATTLAERCYQYMFNGCTNLNYIKAMFTTTPSTTYTQNWVYGVAASGTFAKNSAATWDVSGVNGVPTNWDVQTASA